MAYVVHTRARISLLVSRVIQDSRYRYETERKMRRTKIPLSIPQFSTRAFGASSYPAYAWAIDRLRAVKCDR